MGSRRGVWVLMVVEVGKSLAKPPPLSRFQGRVVCACHDVTGVDLIALSDNKSRTRIAGRRAGFIG